MPLIDKLEEEARELKSCGMHAQALSLRLQLEQLYAESDSSSVVKKARNLNWLAYLGVQTGNLADAERAARKCLLLCSANTEETNATLATYTMMLACVLAESRQFEEGAKVGEVAIRLFVASEHHAEFVEQRALDVERMRRGETGPYLDRD